MSTTEEKATREWNAEIKELGDKIVNLTGLQAKELSDYIKEEHGIEPAAGGAPVMMAAPADGGEDGGGKDEGPTAYDVILTSAGQKKIQVIKALREITGKSLKDAKAMADGAPVAIKENATEEEANELKTKLQDAGGEVELKGK